MNDDWLQERYAENRNSGDELLQARRHEALEDQILECIPSEVAHELRLRRLGFDELLVDLMQQDLSRGQNRRVSEDRAPVHALNL